MKLVHYVINREYPTYAYDEDIAQAGMVGLCKAAKYWDSGKSEFSTYAIKCIRSEICKEFIKRKKHNGEVSLDSNINEDTTLGEIISGADDVDYVDYSFLSELTSKERKVADLKRQGYTTVEIADELNLTSNTVTRTLRMMEAKWRKLYGR